MMMMMMMMMMQLGLCVHGQQAGLTQLCLQVLHLVTAMATRMMMTMIMMMIEIP